MRGGPTLKATISDLVHSSSSNCSLQLKLGELHDCMRHVFRLWVKWQSAFLYFTQMWPLKFFRQYVFIHCKQIFGPFRTNPHLFACTCLVLALSFCFTALLKVLLSFTLRYCIFHVIDVETTGQSKAPQQTRLQIILVWTWLRLNWKLPRYSARMMHRIQRARQSEAEEELVEISGKMNICLHWQGHWQMALLAFVGLVLFGCHYWFWSLLIALHLCFSYPAFSIPSPEKITNFVSPVSSSVFARPPPPLVLSLTAI